MSLQTGSTQLTNGVAEVTVTYPAAFTSTPTVVIGMVSNTVDASVLLLTSVLDASSPTGFTMKFDAAPNSSNYYLDWIAGSMELVASTLTTIGRKLTEVPIKSGEPLDSDRLIMIGAYPLPSTFTVNWSSIKGLSAKLVDAPTSRTQPAAYGSVALDANYFYFRDTSYWVRIPREPDGAWTDAFLLKPTRSGYAALTSGAQLQTVAFDTAFASGDPPVIESLVVQNLSADGAKSVLLGMPVATTLSGFTMALNAATDSANYKVTYRAVQQ